MQLRSYQQELVNGLHAQWNSGVNNVMLVSPTGTGKTVTMSSIIAAHQGYSIAIAHRQELVGQISRTLNKWGIAHQILAGSAGLIKQICATHRMECGYSLYKPTAPVIVAGVDTLTRRAESYKHILDRCTLWVIDEAHHVLPDNKWGKATGLIPNARGIGFTATPCRADGKALDGVFDGMVVGKSMRWAIDNGFLTPYRIYAPLTSDLDLTKVEIGSTGDYKQKQLTMVADKSHLYGDVVEHYKRLANGKLGVTFTVDVASATLVARQFNEAGVPAEAVSAKTPDLNRMQILERFRRREILQLVNVDLFGEGFDLPAIEVVSFARPTASYGLYVQQFGRALRPLEGKTEAIIIDHVGNVMRHGLPDAERAWSLSSGGTPRTKLPDDEIPLRYCIECTQPYPRYNKTCPYCGHTHVTPERSNEIEQVDGDLTELTEEMLDALRKRVQAEQQPAEVIANRMKAAGAPEVAWRGAAKRIGEKRDAQELLTNNIAVWAGYQQHYGMTDAEIYRKFFLLFGTDVMSAQLLGKKESLELAEKINDYIRRMAA